MRSVMAHGLGITRDAKTVVRDGSVLPDDNGVWRSRVSWR